MFSALSNEFNAVSKILYDNHLLLDSNPFIIKNYDGKQSYDLTWAGKNSANSILFDEEKSCLELLSVIRPERQYTFLLYDKSIIQVEYRIVDDEIIKGRLLFLKLQNKVWGFEELREYVHTPDLLDEILNEESGFPIMIRIDFDPLNHVECSHPKAHFVFSNVKDCRIPMKSIATLSQFVNFVFLQFYNKRINLPDKTTFASTITDAESQLFHINW